MACTSLLFPSCTTATFVNQCIIVPLAGVITDAFVREGTSAAMFLLECLVFMAARFVKYALVELRDIDQSRSSVISLLRFILIYNILYSGPCVR